MTAGNNLVCWSVCLKGNVVSRAVHTRSVQKRQAVPLAAAGDALRSSFPCCDVNCCTTVVVAVQHRADVGAHAGRGTQRLTCVLRGRWQTPQHLEWGLVAGVFVPINVMMWSLVSTPARPVLQ